MDYSGPASTHAHSEETRQSQDADREHSEGELPLPVVNILPSTPPQDARDEDAQELADSRQVLTSSPQPIRPASPAGPSHPAVPVPTPQNTPVSTFIPPASTPAPPSQSPPASVPSPSHTPAPAARTPIAGPSHTHPSARLPSSRQSSLASPPPPPPKPIFPPPPAAQSRSASPASVHHTAPSRTTSVRIHEPLSMAGPYPVAPSERPRADRTRSAQRSMSPRSLTGYTLPLTASTHAERARSMLESVNTDGSAMVREKTVGERLAQTQANAEKELSKFKLQARMTKWSLNGAIGVQVVLGALTTGIAAATSGKQTSIAVSVLGGLSTAAASYLAKMRGSGEPEFSSSMCKDLKNFTRELNAYVSDHGAAAGEKHDAAVRHFRDEFERLLGNEKRGGVAEVLKEGVTSLGHQAGGYLQHAGHQAGARVHRGVEDLESGVRAGVGRMQSGVQSGLDGGVDYAERKFDYAERRVGQLASPLYSPPVTPGVHYAPPVVQYTPHGQPVAQYTPSGQPIAQYTPSGQPIAQYTPHGQPMAQYTPSSYFPPVGHTQTSAGGTGYALAGGYNMV